MASQGMNIFFAPEDLAELHEFIKYKTKKRASSANSNMHFSADSFDVDHSLKDTSYLIGQARREMDKERMQRQEAQRQILELQKSRELVGGLNDRDAQKELDRRIAEEAATQAKTYADSLNSGGHGRAYITDEEKSVRDGVVSWIKRQKMRGHFGGQKSLHKK
jgi:hypothetical protein